MSDEAKPKRKRPATCLRFPTELYEELAAAAAERDVSINWLVNRAVAAFLEDLIPADEIRWTRQ